MKALLTALTLHLLAASLSAQAPTDPDHDTPFLNGYVTIEAGGGLCTFVGDVGQINNESFFNHITKAYHFGIERRFGNVLGAGINGFFGELTDNNRSGDYLNFSTPITQFGLYVQGNFDNDFILKRQISAAPFLQAGFSYMLFDPHGDLVDEMGNTYYHWSDGTLRDQPETIDNLPTASVIHRDYNYETQLTDSTANYPRHTYAVPLTLGFRFKLFTRCEARLASTYNVVFSDYLDNVASGSNDAFFYTSFSLAYTIGPSRNKAMNDFYKDVDFNEMVREDSDGDGVKDIDDKCQETPPGVKVDKEGCPLDGDNDGVPDYLDNEETAAGAVVDENGVTLSDSMLMVRSAAMRDSIIMEREQSFHESPTTETLKQIDRQLSAGTPLTPKSAIPDRFVFADTNKDGIIQSAEITDSIDAFFEGTVDVKVADIMDLIDFFFEQ